MLRDTVEWRFLRSSRGRSIVRRAGWSSPASEKPRLFRPLKYSGMTVAPVLRLRRSAVSRQSGSLMPQPFRQWDTVPAGKMTTAPCRFR